MTSKKTKASGAKKRAAKGTKKPGAKVAPKAKAAATKTRAHDPRLPAAGTTIERTFKGTTYTLRVTEDGFALGKETFRSLTQAAKAVTKYPAVSGPRFWLGQGSGKAEKGGA